MKIRISYSASITDENHRFFDEIEEIECNEKEVFIFAWNAAHRICENNNSWLCGIHSITNLETGEALPTY
jgi:hypothetical protein